MITIRKIKLENSIKVWGLIGVDAQGKLFEGPYFETYRKAKERFLEFKVVYQNSDVPSYWREFPYERHTLGWK